ncbi:PREDICTED: G8 domain-containing protein DDB_G0286311-like [Branchiostoma belcheri]|uniref:G8 domain-containing protein DDB_G0286311-like n=1 Tax=Branchiostoma belcheri TaxID=7741 RepID=A0A6P5AGW6_BRABE|nr:PREDICTED: G8 domain-containing protein DDB_G0286311-like [Branchiostoma belcheri]
MQVKRLLVLLLIVLKEADPTAACSSSCSSFCSCNWRDLTSVPQDLPTTITTLNLAGNEITTLSQSDFSSSVSENVRIADNPYQCDCKMLPFKLLMNGSHDFESQITCAGPANLTGQSLLNDVNPEDMICDETTPAPSTAPASTPQPAPTSTPQPAPTSTPQPAPTSTPQPAPTSTPKLLATCSTFWKKCVAKKFWRRASCRSKSCSRCRKRFRKECPDRSTRWTTCLRAFTNWCS